MPQDYSPFRPTHSLTYTHRGQTHTVEVALVEGGLDLGVDTSSGGPAYTREEWEAEALADLERQGDGSWTFKGEPVSCAATCLLTQAEQLAERLHDAPSTTVPPWRTAEGQHLDDAARDAGARQENSEERSDTYRWVFPDGSVLTVAGGGWDLGFPGCFCWRGAGHPDGCVTVQPEK